MRAQFTASCLIVALLSALDCVAQQPPRSLTLRLLPTRDFAVQAKLFARLAHFGESRRETVAAGVKLEDVIRLKCGFLSNPLAAVIAKANTGLEFGATNMARAFDLPPCPYWKFDVAVDIDTVQTISRLTLQRMGFIGKQTIDQVVAMNPGLVNANGRITASAGKIVLPYDSRSFTLLLRRGTGSPASVALALQREFPTLLTPKFITDVGQASFVLDRIVPSAGGAECSGRRTGWPFDPDEIERAIAFNAQRQNDARGRAVVLIVDSGLHESDSMGLPLWENGGEAGARFRSGVDDDRNGYTDDVHGANMNYDPGFPAALRVDQYEDADHGTQVASVFVGNWLGDSLGRIIRQKLRLAMVNVVDTQVTGTEDDGKPRIFVSIPASGVERAYMYADSMLPKANILNISLKSDSPLSINTNLDKSTFLSVVAAGNDHSQIDEPNNPKYPAELRRQIPSRMLVVAAHDGKGELPKFSNYGRKIVDIAAPGCEIPATSFGGAPRSSNGTSVAAPLVSLTAALLYSEGILHPTEIRNRILASSDFDPALRTKVYSSGRLNAARALRIYQDSIVPIAEDGKPGKALFGNIHNADGITLCSEGVALNDTLKVVPRFQENGSPTLVLRRIGQLMGDHLFCSVPESTTLQFTEEGATESKTYAISKLHEIVPRVR